MFACTSVKATPEETKKGNASSNGWHCWMPDFNSTDLCVPLHSYGNVTTLTNLQGKLVARKGSGYSLRVVQSPHQAVLGDKREARSSTVSAVWCWTINPAKWADNGAFGLPWWLMGVAVRVHLTSWFTPVLSPSKEPAGIFCPQLHKP